MIKYVIFSYNREKTIAKDTLTQISKAGVEPKQVYIFVSSEEEKERYEKEVGNEYKIIVGRKGKMHQINFVRNYFKSGEGLVNLDDDLVEIAYCYDEDRDFEPVTNLNKYSKMMFKIMKKYKTGLSGVKHGHILHRGTTTNRMYIGLNQIDGGLFWTINDKSKKLDVFMNTCEDLEFSLKCYEKYGKTILSDEFKVWDRSRTLSNIASTMERKEFVRDQYKLVIGNPKYFTLRKVTPTKVHYSMKNMNRKIIHLKKRRI